MSDACLIPVSKARELAKDNGPDAAIQPIVLTEIMKISNKITEEATLGKLACSYTFGVEFSDSFVKNIKPLDPDAYYSSDFKKELEKRAIWKIIEMLRDAGYKVEYHFSWDNDTQTNRAKLSIYWHDWEKDELTISSIDKMRRDEGYLEFTKYAKTQPPILKITTDKEYLEFMEQTKTSTSGYYQQGQGIEVYGKELKNEID